jgi:hypothetical protein
LLLGHRGDVPGAVVFIGLRNKLKKTLIVHTQINLLEKEKAAAGAVQWSLETNGSLLR